MSLVTPTVVLVHGAFAESASWNGVIARLREAGVPVIAAANPLRSLDGDAASVRSVLESVDGPVVAVGHSYGGAVVSQAADGVDSVKALVFVSAFAPDSGESIGELSGRYPGSTLGDTLETVDLADGTTDLYIRQELYRQQFAADLDEHEARLGAVTQRPLNTEALNGAATRSAWKTVPSWFVYSTGDKNIPVEALAFMADRAGAVESLVIPDASHALPVSQPGPVAEMILRAVSAASSSPL